MPLPTAGPILEQLEGLSPLQLRLQYSAMLARWARGPRGVLLLLATSVLQTILSYLPTAGPLEEQLGPAPPAPVLAPAPVLLLTYSPTAGPLKQLVLLLTMLRGGSTMGCGCCCGGGGAMGGGDSGGCCCGCGWVGGSTMGNGCCLDGGGCRACLTRQRLGVGRLWGNSDL